MGTSVDQIQFLSTPSARRATLLTVRGLAGRAISIHALREEGDLPSRRTPPSRPLFLSTPSARRATACPQILDGDSAYFYPRPPRGGRRAPGCPCPQCQGYFYPRPPRGGRPYIKRVESIPDKISIHALREEGDCTSAGRFHSEGISIHALREEGDVGIPAVFRMTIKDFYPRPPRGGRRISMPIWTMKSNFYPRPPRGGRRKAVAPAGCRR